MRDLAPNAVLIASARRSPIAPRGGALAHLEPHEIAAPVIAALLQDAGICTDRVEDLICSNALGAGGNPARLVSLAAGLPERVAGLSVDRQCVGGLDALMIGRALIASGCAQVVIAGGAESYSRRPIRARITPEHPEGLRYDRPPFSPFPERDPEMASAINALGARDGITRALADGYACAAHARALCATLPEIVPVAGLAHDPFARPLTLKLAARAPVVEGDITAANTAPAADGAAFCLLVSAAFARENGLLKQGLIEMRAGVTLGAAPQDPALAPLPAIARALAYEGITAQDLAQVALMEAYAAQALITIRRAGLMRVNPEGGALARGHPIGASGAVLATRLAHSLPAGARGMAVIAGAGGLGSALILRALA